MELKKINKLNSELLMQLEEGFTLDLSDVEIIKTETKTDLIYSEEVMKDLKKRKTNFSNEIKPIKLTIDEMKKTVLSKEKNEISKIESLINEQDGYVKSYKAEELRKQMELKRQAEEEARRKAEELRKAEEEKRKAEEEAKQKELEEIQKQNKPLAEVIDQIEEKKKEIEEIQEIKIPTVEFKAEKVVLKKDEIKTKKVYSITNENQFIEWALENDRSLLNITINKSEFNKKAKDINQPSFIKVSEVIA